MNADWSRWTLLTLSKGMDGSAPIGPVLVAPTAIKDPHELAIKAIYNAGVVQDSNTRYYLAYSE